MNIKKIIILLIFIICLFSCYQPLDAYFYKDQETQAEPVFCEHHEMIKPTPRPGKYKKPKNIILMISDGCGYNHINAASLYQHGKIGSQVYEQFPIKIGMTTFSQGGSYDSGKAWSDFNYVKSGATDSAAAATAMSTGVKTYTGAIGIDPALQSLKHIIEWAEEAGKMTGVVTSVSWSHATPAGFVAHSESRYNFEEIAKQMVYSSAVDVIMGCGHPFFDDNGNHLSTPQTYDYVGGRETWEDLIAGTAGSDANNDGTIDYWTLIQAKKDFRNLSYGDTPQRVIGVPHVFQTLQQKRSGDVYADPFIEPFIRTIPSLKEMTEAALNILDEDNDGFFLMVEGGAVDWASHSNQSGRMIEEQIDFNKAVKMVVRWVYRESNWNETLLIVTGDHETGYLVGPDSGINNEGESIWNNLVNYGPGTLPGMEWHSLSHTNSLIPFFAKGRCANSFKKEARQNMDSVKGNYIDNTDIAKILTGLY